VSDPAHPRYCFLSFPGGIEAGGEVPEGEPLSAATYCRAYYPGHEPDMSEEENENLERDVRTVIGLFDSEEMITLPMLAEAWPHDFPHATALPTADASAPSSAARTTHSLADLALKIAVENAAHTEDMEAIKDVLWMPGKAELVRAIFQGLPSVPDEKMALLKASFHDHTDRVDLSQLSVSGAQVVELILALPAPENVRVLDVSGIVDLSVSGVTDILCHLSNLERIVLYHTAVTTSDLPALRTAAPTSLAALVHPAVFDDSAAHCLPAAFSVLTLSGFRVVGASTPFATPRRIVRSLVDLLSAFAVEGAYASSSTVACEAVLGCTASTPWNQRSVAHTGRLRYDRELRCPTPFLGEGWMFVYYNDNYIKTTWAFLKFIAVEDAEAPEQELGPIPDSTLHVLRRDLTGFLEMNRATGEAAALASDVAELESLLSKHTIMDEKDLATFMQKVSLR
jgi:hypothetical protein